MPQTIFYAPVTTSTHTYTLFKTLDRLVHLPTGVLVNVADTHYFAVTDSVYYPLREHAIILFASEKLTDLEAERLKDQALSKGWALWNEQKN